LFLAYSYGMGKTGLAKLTSKMVASIDTVSQILEDNFFNAFADIEIWKQHLYETLLNKGRIGTALGNYRNRTKKGPLDAREKRWTVSQVVQGTGALILKRVIKKLSHKIPEAKILLPMHDALLIEVPSDDEAEISREIETVFLDTFIEMCPGTNPRVSLKPFAMIS
ncbi:MAG: DNA polymerase, partial [Desulfobaccales bacterium]